MHGVRKTASLRHHVHHVHEIAEWSKKVRPPVHWNSGEWASMDRCSRSWFESRILRNLRRHAAFGASHPGDNTVPGFLTPPGRERVEVVQIYVGTPSGPVQMPARELRGFTKSGSQQEPRSVSPWTSAVMIYST